MIKASELKIGSTVSINGQPHIVTNLEVKTPSARGAATLYKLRFKNLITGQNINNSLEGDDKFDVIECERKTLQFLYKDNDFANFMDMESYLQFTLPVKDMEEELLFLVDGMENITGLVTEEKLLSVQLPSTVSLKIVDCPPEMRSASASARTKPATLETGLVVQVPDYIANGISIIVNTETKQFVSRG
ncbi:MAG: elongation factor P [Spirochaetes bacterium]|nr:elongation factor P [Spirochaetota bacterium]